MKIETEREASIKQAFTAYIDGVVPAIRTRQGGELLQRTAENCEAGNDFSALVNVLNPEQRRGVTARPLKVFLRRSGIYTDIAQGKAIDREHLFALFLAVFRSEIQGVRLLAPLDAVSFLEKEIVLDGFVIRNYSASELEDIFQTEINRVFYPHATINGKILQDYWFIEVSTSDPPKPVDIWASFLDRSVPKTFNAFPEQLEQVITLLTLWDWEESRFDVKPRPTKNTARDYSDEEGWTRFTVPFILTIQRDLRLQPSAVPEIKGVDYEPEAVPASNGGGYGPESDQEDGIDQCPLYNIHIDDAEQFAKILREIGRKITSVRATGNVWVFLDLALNCFLKAYFTDGLDQLLWHITVIEALLGQKQQGLTSLIKGRVQKIFGQTVNERKAIGKQFEELYEIRSRLVHGNEEHLAREVYQAHLRDARKIARRCLLWFLEYLRFLSSEAGLSPEEYPQREELLIALDLDHESALRVLKTLSVLPGGFPNVPGWR
jgi:hypothetical protein